MSGDDVPIDVEPMEQRFVQDGAGLLTGAEIERVGIGHEVKSGVQNVAPHGQLLLGSIDPAPNAPSFGPQSLDLLSELVLRPALLSC